MICFVEGRLIFQNETHVFIFTSGGTGYKVYFNQKQFSSEEKISLYTAQTFRENGQDLYGFLSPFDLEIFELLCSVKGVGAKSAYSLVNTVGSQNVISTIKTTIQINIFKNDFKKNLKQSH